MSLRCRWATPLVGFGVILVAFTFSACPAVAAASHYTVTRVAVAPGQSAQINAFGHVAGNGGPSGMGFLWADGLLNPLPPTTGVCGVSNQTFDLNNHDDVVGAWRSPSCFAPFRPALWRGDVLHRLPLPAGLSSGFAETINDAREVGGCGYVPDTITGSVRYPPLLWSGGTVKRLPGLTRPANACLTKSAGLHTFVGWSADPADPTNSYAQLAAIWRNGHVHSLGKLPGDLGSEAFGGNSLGEATGWSVGPDNNHFTAVIFRHGAVLPIGPGNGAGINDHDTVVANGPNGPYIWKHGVTYDLNQRVGGPASGWILYGAYDINNAGQIICLGARSPTAPNFVYLLLTPRRS